MDLFSELEMEYKDYETRRGTIDGADMFEIINPFGCDNIRAILDGEDIILSFAFQHAHFGKNMDGIIEYINDYLKSEWVSIEFFEGENDLFGGERNMADIDTSSGESLLKSFTGDNRLLYEDLYEQLKGRNCCCSIRGWNAVNNLDIDFILL